MLRASDVRRDVGINHIGRRVCRVSSNELLTYPINNISADSKIVNKTCCWPANFENNCWHLNY